MGFAACMVTWEMGCAKAFVLKKGNYVGQQPWFRVDNFFFPNWISITENVLFLGLSILYCVVSLSWYMHLRRNS